MKGAKVELNYKRLDDSERGFIHLSPEPGNYEFKTFPKANFNNLLCMVNQFLSICCLTENLNEVFEKYFSPGLSITDGKSF